MKITLEINDEDLSRAVSDHLCNAQTMREAVAKAFNKAEFVGLLSDKFAAALKETIAPSVESKNMWEVLHDNLNNCIRESIHNAMDPIRKKADNLETKCLDLQGILASSAARRLR